MDASVPPVESRSARSVRVPGLVELCVETARSGEFTTTSTTYVTPTPVEISARPKDFDGRAWVYVEITVGAVAWGLAHLQVSSIYVLHTII